MQKFVYISKRDLKVKEAYEELCLLINKVQDLVRDDFTFSFKPIGSYKRNMITYIPQSNVGFDIEVNDDDEDYKPKEIKDILRNAFNHVVYKYGYDYPEDSTRVLTIKKKDCWHSRIVYSCDFAIVKNGSGNQQYIRFNKKNGAYSWCEQGRGYKKLPEKITWLKEHGLWNEVRELYIEKKNNNKNEDIHSRTIFVQTIHEVCQRSNYYR